MDVIRLKVDVTLGIDWFCLAYLSGLFQCNILKYGILNYSEVVFFSLFFGNLAQALFFK